MSTSRAAIGRGLSVKSSRHIESRHNPDTKPYEKRTWVRTSEAILQSLRFTEIEDRYEEIKDAEEQTFEWIFTDRPNSTPGWSSLPLWLQSTGDLYWIEGKPGSGKSTLMRYIFEHPKTREHLSLWAGGIPLVMAKFFFWNSGAAQQKTQEGLLRSLLYQILRQRPDFLRIVMPDEWSSASAKMLPEELQAYRWSVRSLQKSLSILIKESAALTKFGLFIDGLDEHNSDHKSLITLITDLAASENVKVLASSRPLVEFADAFSDCPTLKLQDLTYNDIKIYIDTRLKKSKNTVGYFERQPKKKDELVAEIANLAGGVFLWVRLAVDSLLEGIRGFDRPSELERRLHELPTDLGRMFDHMLNQVPSRYHEHRSRLFQLVRSAREFYESVDSGQRNQQTGRIYTLLLSIAQEEELDPYGPPDLASPEAMLDRCDQIQTWLKTRCAGLLETRSFHADESNESSPGERLINIAEEISPNFHISSRSKYLVTYIHRSARDFLEQPPVWHRIVNQTADASFDPYVAWTRAWLYFLKYIMPSRQVRDNYNFQLIGIATEAEERAARPCPSWSPANIHEDDRRRIFAAYREEIIKKIAYWIVHSELDHPGYSVLSFILRGIREQVQDPSQRSYILQALLSGQGYCSFVSEDKKICEKYIFLEEREAHVKNHLWQYPGTTSHSVTAQIAVEFEGLGHGGSEGSSHAQAVREASELNLLPNARKPGSLQAISSKQTEGGSPQGDEISYSRSQESTKRDSGFSSLNAGDYFSKSHQKPDWFDRVRIIQEEFFRHMQNDRRVKIAILDTGVDIEHPFFQHEDRKDRILKQNCKSFVGAPSTVGYEDKVGHGTHATGILLIVAPEADIYVARVSEDEDLDDHSGAEIVTKAIHWAVDQNVDIISMSFGFSKPQAKVEEAITRATGKSILIFAAASNDGANPSNPVAWPARRTGVFAINAANEYGRPSEYTANQQIGINFSVIGDKVNSAWPLNLGADKEGMKRQSGTSFATPVAAALAALTLEFVWEKEQMKERIVLADDVDFLHKFDGMTAVLKEMSEMVEGYQYLKPWNLWQHKRENVKSNICSALYKISNQL